MRRGSSTVIVLVGGSPEVLSEVGRSPNVVVAAGEGTGLEPAVETLSAASRHVAPYVLVTPDPLGELALAWHRMWDVGAGSGTTAFEDEAGRLLTAWRSGRFELPDYYVVLASEQRRPGAPHPHDLHLGVLRSQRPSRVVSVPVQPGEEGAAGLRSTIGSLPSGAWWPPLDRIVDAARSFFPDRVTAGVPAASEARGLALA